MSELPKGWEKKTIGSLCKLINGRAFKPSDWTTTGLPIVRIQNLNDPNSPYNRYNGEVNSRFLINTGALLFAWSGTPGTSFGAHIWNNGQAILNQHIFNIIFDEAKINKRFLQLAINQKLDELVGKAHGGVGLGHVTKGKFEETEILLPPLDEQRRIVARLDALLARSKRARAELARVPGLVERQKQAVLERAFSGELTREWRASEGLPEPKTTTLGAVASDFSYGSAAKSQEAGLVPVLRMGNIQDGRLDWENLVFTSDRAEIAKYRLESGDVLFNRTNSPELVGKTALYQGEREAIYAGYLIRIKCTPNLLPKFLTYCLNSPMGRDYCWQVKTDGVSQSNINSKKLAAFSFNLPSLKEQLEVVRRIEAAFARIDRTAAEVERAATLVDRLDQATLARAFRGEL